MVVKVFVGVIEAVKSFKMLIMVLQSNHHETDHGISLIFWCSLNSSFEMMWRTCQQTFELSHNSDSP